MPGIAIGGMCPACARALEARAGRIARLVAGGSTLALAVYIALTLPSDRTARIVGAVSVVVWYVLTFRVAKRVAWEWIK